MPDYLVNPLVLVIFGITGDLAKRKLLPALYHLQKSGQLPEQYHIVGISRHNVKAKDLFNNLKQSLPKKDYDKRIVKQLVSKTEIKRMDLSAKGDYQQLLKYLKTVEDKLGPDVNRLYYLSVPPGAVTPIVRHLGECGHNDCPPGRHEAPRLMLEKPFGHDLESAKQLIGDIGMHFSEDQIYRIDHYLARETAQNILVFRSENPLFQSVWNNRHIDHITVLAHESIGIEGRASFYEGVGALRDLLQSHLLQLLAITTMDRPGKLSSKQIHAKKLELLKSIKQIEPTKAWRGQYKGYTDEVNNPNSDTETYARVQLEIGSKAWHGVSVVLETGKAMEAKKTQIIVCFRQESSSDPEHNQLKFRIQPGEGITLRLQAKHPGVEEKVEPVKMKFNYDDSFGERQLDPYERVIIDAMRGDQALFASAEEVLESWRIFDKILASWTDSNKDLVIYEKGSLGPNGGYTDHVHAKK